MARTKESRTQTDCTETRNRRAAHQGFTLSADSVGVRWLLDNNPKQWAKVAEAFETKKAKIGVKVEAY
jgi:hypothetical protein